MEMHALIVADEVVNRPARGDFAATSVRRLLVVDRCPTPLSAMLTVNVDPEDPVSPVSKGAPSLVGSQVLLGITDLSQFESGKLNARGCLLKIEGTYELKPIGAPK